MRWQGGRRGGGVEDRRGMGGKAVGGGIGAVLFALIGYFVLSRRRVSRFGWPGRAGVGMAAARLPDG